MSKKKQSLTVLEKFGAFCALCASVYLISISIYPVMHNLAGEFEKNAFIFNSILLLIGTGSLFGSIRFIKKNILFEQLLDLGKEDLPACRLSVVFRVINHIREFVQRRARLLSKAFFVASFILFLLVLITTASMIGKLQLQVPIKPDQLMLLGIHVFVFFSIGRKLRKKSVAWDSVRRPKSQP